MICFVLNENGFPRHGYEIYKNGQKIGQVTSGTVSPLLEKGIGLGYVPVNYSQIGSEIEIKIRDNFLPAQIVKPPFV